MFTIVSLFSAPNNSDHNSWQSNNSLKAPPPLPLSLREVRFFRNWKCHKICIFVLIITYHANQYGKI